MNRRSTITTEEGEARAHLRGVLAELILMQCPSGGDDAEARLRTALAHAASVALTLAFGKQGQPSRRHHTLATRLRELAVRDSSGAWADQVRECAEEGLRLLTGVAGSGEQPVPDNRIVVPRHADAILRLGDEVTATTRSGGTPRSLNCPAQIRNVLELLALSGPDGTDLSELGKSPQRIKTLVSQVRNWIATVFHVTGEPGNRSIICVGGRYRARVKLLNTDAPSTATCASCQEEFRPRNCSLCSRLVTDRCPACHAELEHGDTTP